MTVDLDEFAEAVGTAGPVSCVGGRTSWALGGAIDANAREVRAPNGIVSYRPDEMTVTVMAGTAIHELTSVLAERRQTVAIPPRERSTVGGALAVGRSSILQLGHGHVRDTLLQARFINAGGEIVKVGGPTVKNVTGFDVCRLLVGSFGTLGFFGEVILRTRPTAPVSAWFCAHEVDPFELRRVLYRPTCILWDGYATHVCLQGNLGDVSAQLQVLGPLFKEESDPSDLSRFHFTWKLAPSDLRSFAQGRQPGSFMTEIGIGTAVCHDPQPLTPVDHRVALLESDIKNKMDPLGRLNPGRSPRGATD